MDIRKALKFDETDNGISDSLSELADPSIEPKMQQHQRIPCCRLLRALAAWKVFLAMVLLMIPQRLLVVDCQVLVPPHAHVFSLERGFRLNRLVDLDSIHARDLARHTRFTLGVTTGAVDFTLNGSSDPFKGGLYFTKVKIGSPPREYRVQVDTGSDVLWITCSSCTNCPRTSELGVQLSYYDTKTSSTAKTVTCSDSLCTSNLPTSASVCLEETDRCGYSFQYGDGSGTSGYYVTDDLYFDTILNPPDSIANSSAEIIFGCSTYQSGDLMMTDKAVDGIIGFGPGDMSVFSQLSSRGISPKVFSHCLKGDSAGGGSLVIGEISEPDIVYTALVPSQAHYNLNLESISVNGQSLPIDPAVFATSSSRGTIVDSGTTLTYLVKEAFDPFVRTITTAASPVVIPATVNGTQCFIVSTSVAENFPPVSINFVGGVSMSLKPDDYLVRVGSMIGSPLWCIGFEKAEQGVSILGDLVLKDKIVVYDLSQQRIGWAPRDCSASVNVSTTFSWDKLISSGQTSISVEFLLFKLLPMSSTALVLQVLLFLVIGIPTA